VAYHGQLLGRMDRISIVTSGDAVDLPGSDFGALRMRRGSRLCAGQMSNYRDVAGRRSNDGIDPTGDSNARSPRPVTAKLSFVSRLINLGRKHVGEVNDDKSAGDRGRC
jgi:hypothetical protein